MTTRSNLPRKRSHSTTVQRYGWSVRDCVKSPTAGGMNGGERESMEGVGVGVGVVASSHDSHDSHEG
jgi:hypothetical protein